MGVAGERQSVVADVVGGVERLGHGAHSHRRDGVFFGRAFDFCEELVHFAGDGTAFRGFEKDAEAQDELAEAVELLLARGVVDAVDHRPGRPAAVGVDAVAAKFGDTAVGQQHEFLDHLVRFLLFLEADADGAARFVQLEFHFFALEADGAVPEALAAQFLGQPVEGQHLLGVVAAPRFDDFLRFGVGETAVGVDDRAAEPFVENVEILVEGEDRREAKAVFVGPQRAEFVGEPFGQHRHGAVDQIDRRAAFDGFVVDDRVRPDVVRHVGDVHADFPHPVADAAHRQRVVEVLGVGRVDGESGRRAEVAPGGDFLFGDAAVDGLGGVFDLRLEAVGEFVFGENGVHLGVVLPGHAQHFDQLAHGALAAGLPVDDAHDDFFALAHAGVFALGEVDVHRHLARIGPHEYLVGAHLGHADVGFAAALDDAGDFAL